MFIPGASKQTMDNLVKENARLRSLLKSHEGQTEKRSSEVSFDYEYLLISCFERQALNEAGGNVQ